MKVNDLLENDFENINIKKLDTQSRYKILNRKLQGLCHQTEMLADRKEVIFQRLIDAGTAYSRDDEQYKRNPSHYSLGEFFILGKVNRATYYINHTPENKVVFDHINALERRLISIRIRIIDLRKSLKGMKSALTRKKNEADRQKRYDQSRHILGMK